MPRPKQKVLEVLSLHSVLREHRPGDPKNLWVAEVKVEIRGPVYQFPARTAKRTVHIKAKDELAAFMQLITEGV